MVTSSGSYHVTESGLDYRLDPNKAKAAAEDSKPLPPDMWLERFHENFEIRVLEQPSPNELVLELIHIDTSLVNALRRILLAEVPTVALELIYMWNNTSIIHDEVLAHRIGLIPLHIDARMLEEAEPDDPPTDRNTVVFRMSVACSGREATSETTTTTTETISNDVRIDEHDETVVRQEDLEEVAAQVATAAMNSSSSSRNQSGGGGGGGPSSAGASISGTGAAAAAVAAATKVQYPKGRPYTKHVYSRDLIWVPQGDQADRLRNVRPIHDDILIAKLRRGQAIELEAHGRVGIGKDHAKFSPVCTASYRLMPQIELVKPIYDTAAEELVYVYEPGVFTLVPTNVADGDPIGTVQKAVLCNPYACTMSRNFMRHPILAQSIRMTRKPDHFIFQIESVGMYKPCVLFAEALRLLQHKCHRLHDLIEEYEQLQEQEAMLER